jgi:hypothetical protein
LSTAALAALLGIGLAGCLQPIPNQSDEAGAGKSAKRQIPGLQSTAYPAYTFYDEDFQQGGFTFVYGGGTKINAVEGEGADSSEYFLHAKLDQTDYSGVAVCLWNMDFDVSPYVKTGALVFQLRGKVGGEKLIVGLGDDEKTNGWKSVVRLPLAKYGTVKQGEWTTFVVPLRDLGKRGVAWDAAHGVEIPMPFQWDKVQEFRILTNKGDQPECEVDIDNVQIWANAVAPEEGGAGAASGDWLDMDKNSDGPTPEQMKLDDEVVGSFFVDDPAPGGFTYGYGGKTTSKSLECTTPGNAQVWAAYFDNDWSGLDISLGTTKFMDMSAIRRTGSLTFWIKGGPKAEKFYVGLLDNEGNDKKVQTKVIGNDYVVVKEGKWSQCRIPLKAFIDDGAWWDASQSREVAGKVDWSKIQEIRISIGRDENKVEKGQPVAFYFDQIEVTKTAKGLYDPDAYWDAFKSDAPDVLVTDFSKWNDKWQSNHGSTADIKHSFVPLPKGAPSFLKGQALKIDFKPGDWFETLLQFPQADGIYRDWSKHYAVSFWMYTEKPYQSIDVTIQDRDKEYFQTKVGDSRGWHQIVVPFRNFPKFPYYQPPDAIQNNRLDLDGVFQMGFKPGGDIPGTVYLANVQITNLHEVTKTVAPPVVPAVFSGSLGKVVQPIPKIYGINVGLWAPELMDAASVEVEKPLNLGVVRYPGGLRSDEEDWEKTLKDKDFNIDTDEFLDWCAKVGVEPMFTADVGDGTPERAAKWVTYVNKTRKGPRVKYWEIGNEVYGNWHKYYEKWGKDGGVAYGKAVREFVKAMKAADPDIKITCVWMLTGNWNKTVFSEVADLVDGVNVHHYAQGATSENDVGLLAVSGEADQLMKDVRKQVEELGVKGKKYDIWLTEWNSVDFNPGPQILQHVEGLFVADYLGHLAQSPIQIANLWAIFNGRDKRMGDYGILSTAGDPQGLNAKRPAYWAMKMMANTLQGDLLKAEADQELLTGWLSKGADGKVSIVLINKNRESDYKTTLKIPGLKGTATVETLTKENSGGLMSNEATGKTYPSTGPTSEKKTLGDGSVITVPKYSVMTIKFD